jgi:hypothetical protein
MKIEILNVEAVNNVIKNRINSMEPVFQKAVEQEKEELIRRTQSGVDVDGKAFEAYSDEHEWNWKDVRRANDKQTAYVDLTFKGDMFNALKVRFKREGFKFLATLFFNGSKQKKKALGHQTGRLGKVTYEPRRFFGLSNSQRGAIISKLRNVK